MSFVTKLLPLWASTILEYSFRIIRLLLLWMDLFNVWPCMNIIVPLDDSVLSWACNTNATCCWTLPFFGLFNLIILLDEAVLLWTYTFNSTHCWTHPLYGLIIQSSSWMKPSSYGLVLLIWRIVEPVHVLFHYVSVHLWT